MKRGGSIVFAAESAPFPQRLCLLRVPFVVALVAQRYEVVIGKRQIGVLVGVLDVVYLRRLGKPAVFPAVLAAVSI